MPDAIPALTGPHNPHAHHTPQADLICIYTYRHLAARLCPGDLLVAVDYFLRNFRSIHEPKNNKVIHRTL
jgi:hypothetical protein